MPDPSSVAGSYTASADNPNSFSMLAWAKSPRQEQQASGTQCMLGWEPVLLFDSEFSALWAHPPWWVSFFPAEVRAVGWMEKPAWPKGCRLGGYVARALG